VNRSAILRHLEALVACDTQNPPRRIDGNSHIFSYCESVLPPGFETRIWDHGDGHVSWLAVRGRPRVLFNVHLDTVPAGEGWTSDPHALLVKEARAYGRGACDIKGAAAVLLSLAEQGAEHLALLFTSDEEGAGGCCVARFVEAGEADRFRQVIVAEPTACRAVLGHRGFLSVKARFSGTPGHSSEPRALRDNANHQMARWAAQALRLVESHRASPTDPGSCFNIGLVDGGTKSNVIAGSAFVHWSARLQPGQSPRSPGRMGGALPGRAAARRRAGQRGVPRFRPGERAGRGRIGRFLDRGRAVRRGRRPCAGPGSRPYRTGPRHGRVGVAGSIGAGLRELPRSGEE
jgi:acetylornithine deacetylase